MSRCLSPAPSTQRPTFFTRAGLQAALAWSVHAPTQAQVPTPPTPAQAFSPPQSPPSRTPSEASPAIDTATLQTVVISGRGKDLIGVSDSATEGVVSTKQLRTRPLLRPAEVLETVPGLTVTQHSGDGKANQYFLRGFNLDHGSDFATFVNSAPVNLVSHAHGQGYMDLNFLIPELIGSMRYRKGMYAAEDGDFVTTGSARIGYVRQLVAPMVDLSMGPHGWRRALGAASRSLGADGEGPVLLSAVEAVDNNGPWDQPEHLRKRNAVLRLSDGSEGDGWSATAQFYDAHWTATEHVPERAIASGEIGRYGALMPDDGGRTHRHSLTGEWARRHDNNASTRVSAYVVDYGLNLYSNPSGYINGSEGDQHKQSDQRIVLGGQVSHGGQVQVLDRATEWTLGTQLRHDHIGTLGLYDTVARQRTGTVREDEVRQTTWGLFGEARTHWTPWLRSTLGLRWDRLTGRVTPTGGEFNRLNGGTVGDRLLSPRVGLAFGPFQTPVKSELYVNWGQGLRSNDLRGATTTVNPRDGSAADRVRPLVRASSAELGLRLQPLRGWTSSLALWRMNLDSELVFVGDEGVTEPRGASRRVGVEWSNDWQVNRWLLLDGDIAGSRARFREAVNGGTHVPNAIPLSASLAAAVDGGGAWFGGLRWRYVGSYALEESGTHRSTAFWTANLKVGWRADRRLQFTVDVLNLFNRQANDIEYWGTACTRSEGAGCGGGEGIEGRLVHPMEPRTMRLSMRATF